MRKKTIIILIASFLFPAFITEAQVEVVSDGTVRVGADNFDPGDKDFTVLDVQNNTVTSNDAYSSMRMDNLNNYLKLNRRTSDDKNEIIWHTNNNDYWRIGLSDASATFWSSHNSFFIGKNSGGTNPFIWLDNDLNNIGLFTKNPDLSYKLTLYGDALTIGGSWQSSDINLKQNINRIESSLEKLLTIRGITYEYNSEFEALVNPEFAEEKDSNYVDTTGDIQNQLKEISNPLSKNRYGVIAQEVMEHFPDLVHLGSNGYYAVNYDGLIPVLIEAIKEQHSIIENLQAEITLLKQREQKSQLLPEKDEGIPDQSPSISHLQDEIDSLKLQIIDLRNTSSVIE